MIEQISKIEAGKHHGDRYTTVWFENGGHVRFIQADVGILEEYFTPDYPNTLHKSYGVSTDCSVYEHLVIFLDDYSSHHTIPDLRYSFPDCFLDTLGIDPEEIK